MSKVFQPHNSKNPLLNRDEIGKSKTSGFKIPQGITFGKKAFTDTDGGVKEAVNNWHMSSPTEGSKRIQDFISMNKNQAQNGIYQSKEVHNYRQQNMITKEKKTGNLETRLQLPSENFVYGKPAYQEADMKKIMYQEYRKDSEQYLNNYYQNQNIQSQQEHKIFQERRAKSIGLRPQVKVEEEQKDMFKIKKYQQVESKYKNIGKINWNDILEFKK